MLEYFAFEAFEQAVLTGENQVFISASKRQALVFAGYIKVAAQLTWSRVVNTTGHNVAADLQMEHLNTVVKGCAAKLGANISEQTIVQCGRSLNVGGVYLP